MNNPYEAPDAQPTAKNPVRWLFVILLLALCLFCSGFIASIFLSTTIDTPIPARAGTVPNVQLESDVLD